MLKQDLLNSERKAIKAAWKQFIQSSSVPDNAVREEVLASWKRVQAIGVDPYSKGPLQVVDEGGLQVRLNRNSKMLSVARPLVRGLYELIRSFDIAIILTDQDAVVLEVVCDSDMQRVCSEHSFTPGISLSEKDAGTNSVPLAIRHDKPFQMMPGEHYCKKGHILTCASAPIHDESGKVSGVLAVTGMYHMAYEHPHTLGMVATAAQAIENHLRLTSESEKSFLMSEYLNAAIAHMSTGIITLSRQGAIMHMNPAAEKLLGVEFKVFEGRNVESAIQNKDVIAAIQGLKEINNTEIVLQDAKNTRCLVSLKHITDSYGVRMGCFITLEHLKQMQKLARKLVGGDARYTFEDIKGSSPAMREAVRLAGMASKSNSNVLILGESGTGKEMLAQSIHNAGSRAQGPFLAINCAAIPDELIESELFGYEAGTFTGALEGGKSGKFELVEGGTLFLDEVDGMSLGLQSKLLRVLEERRFLRLGGTRYFDLDARIICATNKVLSQVIERGHFRRDLYYRINVLEIQVPPLRLREDDVAELAWFFMHRLSMDMGKDMNDMTPEVLSYLKCKRWSGNVRELKNWIERALNFTDSQILTLADLPQDSEGRKLAVRTAPSPTAGNSEGAILSHVERDAIRAALCECKGNVMQATRMLGIGRATLYRKIKKYHLDIPRADRSET